VETIAYNKERISMFTKELKHSDTGRRQLAIFALGEAGKTKLPKTQLLNVIKSLGKRLKKEQDNGLKTAIVIALGQIKHPKIIPYLGEMAQNKDHYVKQSAIYYLGKTRNPKALKYINKAMNDKNNRIKRTAAEAEHEIKYSIK
jgi:hypothetical protein